MKFKYCNSRYAYDEDNGALSMELEIKGNNVYINILPSGYEDVIDYAKYLMTKMKNERRKEIINRLSK